MYSHYYAKNHKLTGNIRHRNHKTLFKSPVLVLQVEETYDYVNSPFDKGREVTHWRDALAQDVLQGVICLK